MLILTVPKIYWKNGLNNFHDLLATFILKVN